MRRRIVLWLISGSLLQAFESLTENDLNASSDLHVRTKRIIDQFHDRDERVLHQEVHYIVPLLKPDGIVHCTGIILSSYVVLTAAHCLLKIKVTVVSGIPKTINQRFHTVASVMLHEHYDPKSIFINDLGLITVREPIDIYHSYNRPISIYNGTLPPNSMGLVSGWGHVSRDKDAHTSRARSILVPIVGHQRCQQILRGHLQPITPKHICTYFSNRAKCCWYGDSGGPLVYNGYLIGVFSTFDNSGNSHLADVFMNLLDPEYKSWVEYWVMHIHNTIIHHH